MNAEQLKIIATHTPREAATILGVHIRTVRYHKQRMEGKSVQLKEPNRLQEMDSRRGQLFINFWE
jgi:transposase